MIINSNISALNARRHLADSLYSINTATQRLSSGRRINSAADDAAGMVIANRMTAQIRGMDQARRNANDGISLVQTAEGALIQMTNNLQRIRELSVQAANDTNTKTDRQTIQKEVEQLKREINRIAETTQFNGINLLNGRFSAKKFQVGPNSDQTIGVDINDARGQSIGNNRLLIDGKDLSQLKAGGSASFSTLVANGDSSKDQTLKIFGRNSDAVKVTVKANSSVEDLVNTINQVSGRTGVEATARTDVAVSDFKANTSYSISLQSLNASTKLATGADAAKYKIEFKVGSDGSLSDAIARINAKSDVTGVSAQLDSNNSNRIILSSETGRDIFFTADSARKLSDGSKDNTATVKVAQIRSFERVDGYVESAESGNLKGDEITINFDDKANAFRAYGSIEIHSNDSFSFDFEGVAADASTLLGDYKGPKVSTLNSVSELNVSTRNGANDAIRVIDAALATLDAQRADLGAIQNRLVGTISNLRIGAENLSAARSRILDSDYAEETAALARGRILQQVATAMLAQANQQPQLALQLLR